jgi:phage-related protein
MPNGTKVVEMKTRVGVAGEQTYREALKNISRELRVQKVEMDAVTSAYGANQNSIEALSAKQEALTKQQDAHREKVQILSEMLEIAKQEFGENSEEADQYRIKLATAQTALNKCSNEINTTSTALAEAQKATQESADATDDLGDTVGEAGDALDEYGEAAGETGDSLGELGDSADDASGKNQAFLSVMAGAAKTLGNVVVAGAKLAAKALLEVGKAAANATKEGFELSKEAGKYADDIATLSTQTGVSQSSLQQWTYASNFVDTSVDSIASSMTKLTQTMGNALNGSSEASDKFATLGVSITDVHGRLRSTEDVFWDAIDALGKIENPAERDAAAIALFGESAQKLNPLIAAGREGFEALNAEAERLGTVFNDDEIATMGSFDDAMQRNSQAVTGLKNAIGLALIPAFQPLVNRATEAMGRVNHAIRDGITPDEMGELMDYLLDEMDGAIEYIISIIEDALPMLTTAVGKLVSSLGSKLPGMVNRLLPAVTQLLQTLVNTLSANAAGIGQAAGQLVAQLAAFLVSNLPALASAAVQLVSGLFSGLLAAIEPCWEAVKDGVGEAMGKVWTGITSAFGTLGGILETVLNLPEGTITKPLSDAVGAVGDYFAEVWGAITGAFGTLSGILKDLLTGNIDLGDALEAAKSTVEEKFKEVWTSITSVFGTLGGILGNVLNLPEGTITDPLNKAIGAVGGYFAGVWNAITGAFGTLGGILKDLLTGKISLGDALETAKNTVKEKFQEVWDAICSVFGTFTNIIGSIFGVDDLGDKVKEKWGDIKGGVTEAFSQAWSDILGSLGNLADWFGHIWDGVAGAITNAWESAKEGIGTAITGAWDWITGLFGGGEEETHGSGVHTSSSGADHGSGGREFPETAQGSTVVQDVVSDQVLSQLVGSISGEEDGVREAMQTVLQAAIDATNELMTVDAGKPLGKDWVTGVADGIHEDGHKVQDEMGTVFNNMLAALQAVVDSGTFNRIGTAISSGIAVGIRSGTGAVVQAARSAARQAYYAARTELNVNSPSKKTREIGESYTEGFALGIERTTPRIVEAAQALSNIALRTTQTTRSNPPIDYNQFADAAIYAARQGAAPAGIDYDRMGDATAAAMRREGIGQTTMVMDRQIVARTIEPSVSRSSADRGNHTIAGRTAKLVIV